MNDRIQELARRSGALPTQDCGVPQWYIDEDEFEKFAELIVRECAEVITETRWHLPPTQQQIAVGIKEHFGVNE